MYKITFLFLILSFTVQAQTTYTFDHVLEYEFQKHKDSLVEKCFILTNSKESYFAEVSQFDEDTLYMNFVDRDRAITAHVTVDRKDFLTAETFEMPCESVHPYKEFKHRTRKYEYIVNPDTLYFEKPHKFYTFKSVKPKRERRKRLSRLHFIVQPGTEYHNPVLTSTKAFDEWEKEGSIPQGIPTLFYYTTFEKDTVAIHRLLKIYKLKKYIRIEKECFHRATIIR